MDNNAALSIGAYPADLQKAYTIVSQYKMTDAVMVPKLTEQNVFATISNDEGAQDDEEIVKRERKTTGTRKKHMTRTQEDGAVEVAQDSEKRTERKVCKICKSTKHWTGNCPELEEVVKSYKAAKVSSATDVQDEHVGVLMDGGVLRATDFVVF